MIALTCAGESKGSGDAMARGVAAGADIGVMGGLTGAAAGVGAGAVEVRVGWGTGAGAGAGAAGGGAPGVVPDKIAPSSRLTSFGAAVFPEKNSPAVSDGSADGAGGKMSDWNESD